VIARRLSPQGARALSRHAGPPPCLCFAAGTIGKRPKVKMMRSKWTNRIGTAYDKEAPKPDDLVSRLLGGPPLAVLVRLVLLSIVVGFILSAAGLDPLNILHSIENLVRQVWDMGFDAVRWVWRYFLLGAVLVVPIWLLVRLARGATGRGWR
jgi:hypothetical protein